MSINRIGTANMYDSTINNLGSRQSGLVDLMEKTTAGKRVLRASDGESALNIVGSGVPIDLRELVLDERDNGDALRRRMQAGDISVDENLTRYHDEYRRSFRESDSGRRFEDAFQVIITDEGRQQIDAALRDIAHTPYLAGESDGTNSPSNTSDVSSRVSVDPSMAFEL